MSMGAQLVRVRRVATLAGWSTVSQVLSALSNLIITLAVARGGGTETLGRFSVAFAAYLVVLGFSRSLASEPLLASPQRADDRSPDAASTTVTLLVAGAGALVVGLVGLLLGRVELLVVAAALPVTLIQDLLRHQAFRRGTPAIAALIDGGWLLGSVMAWPIVTNSDSASVAVLCWAGGAIVGISLACLALRPRPSTLRSAVSWWRTDARGLSAPLVLESFIFAVSSQAVVFVVASMAGDSELGTLRAGQIYFAPLLLVLIGLGTLAVPQFAQRPSSATNLLAIRLCAGLAVLACLVCLGIILAEPILHAVLYSDSIEVPRALLVPLACQVVLSAAAGGFVIVTKARRRGGDLALSRLSSTVLGLVLLVLATAAYGVQGAAWALVAQGFIYAVDLGLRVIRTAAPAAGDNGRLRTEIAHD